MGTYVGITLNTETCCRCGVVFGMESKHIQRLRNNHAFFYCPNGHSQYYTAESEAEKLRREIESKNNELRAERNSNEYLRVSLSRQEKQTAVQKGQKTRIINRIKKGICPHCNRQFKNLHRHMDSKHNEIES